MQNSAWVAEGDVFLARECFFENGACVCTDSPSIKMVILAYTTQNRMHTCFSLPQARGDNGVEAEEEVRLVVAPSGGDEAKLRLRSQEDREAMRPWVEEAHRLFGQLKESDLDLEVAL